MFFTLTELDILGWFGHTTGSEDWSSLGTGHLWGLVISGDWSPLGTGHLWGLVTSGDWSPLGTGHLWGLVTSGDWSSLGTGHLWGLVTSGDWSPLGTGHLWGLVTSGDWSPLGTGHLWGLVTSGDWSPLGTGHFEAGRWKKDDEVEPQTRPVWHCQDGLPPLKPADPPGTTTPGKAVLKAVRHGMSQTGRVWGSCF